MQKISLVSFSGVFSLRDGISEEEFLPRLHAFLQHFIDVGFANHYRIMRREALDGFGKTLPAFTYRGELVYPDLEREHAAYEYVKQRGEPVHSLHVRSEEHTSELQSLRHLVCRLLLEKKKT